MYCHNLLTDSATNDCEAIQQTPVSHHREITYFVYNVDIHVQTAIEELPAGTYNSHDSI